MQTTISTTHEDDARATPRDEDGDYELLIGRLRSALLSLPGPLFTTSASEGLYEFFVGAMPADRRQHYTCRTCRKFVERFGGLVSIDESGTACSPFWDGGPFPAFFAGPARALCHEVARAKVTGVFLSSDPVYGTPHNDSPKAPTGVWTHMAAMPHAVHKASAVKTTAMAVAEKHEEYGMLCRGLADFPIDVVRQAHTLLTTDQLYRSEKCIGVAKWLLGLHEARESTKHRNAKEHLTWRAVALAPPGFCHVRSTMIGTLLEDIAAGKPFADIKRAFDTKMAPLNYARPKAPPTDGQLAAAEAVVSKLASAGSLNRRYATVDEVLPHAIWTPRPVAVEPPAGGAEVFGHLKSSARKPDGIEVPAQTITWAKFSQTVLPGAERIELLVPREGNFFAFITAADASAPPILQWDREEARNPVNWYVYPHGSQARDWDLMPGEWREVAALTMQPSSWTTPDIEHHGNGLYFVMRGMTDKARQANRCGLALFPECLRTEYHGIRSAIEAYSRSKQLAECESAACGIALQKASRTWTETFRITSRGGTRLTYKIDRWD